VSIETEIKVRVEDAAAFLQRLEKLRPRVLSKRHFEDNFVLDFPDRRLRAGQRLLRVRVTGDASFLTYKGPPRPSGLFKSREELETIVGEGRSIAASSVSSPPPIAMMKFMWRWMRRRSGCSPNLKARRPESAGWPQEWAFARPAIYATVMRLFMLNSVGIAGCRFAI
jgi:hypothetical protein